MSLILKPPPSRKLREIPLLGEMGEAQKVIPLVGEMGEAQKGCRRAKVAVFARKRCRLKAAEGANVADIANILIKTKHSIAP